jgi:hypothetical protein
MPQKTAGFIDNVRNFLNLNKEYTATYITIILIISFFPSLVRITPHGILSSYTNVVMTMSAILCLFLSWRIFTLHKETEFRRIGVCFVIYFAFWGLAEISWALYDTFFKITPVPTIADLFWLLGYVPLFYICTSTLGKYREHVSTSDMARIAFVWGLILLPTTGYLLRLIAFSPEPFLPRLVNTLYPLLDSVLILLLFVLLVMYRNAKLETYWLIITVGMLANAVGDLLFLYFETLGIYEVGSLPDNFFMLSYLVIAFGFFTLLKAKIIYFKTAPLPEREDTSESRYVVERGSVYLFKESEMEKSLEVFCDLVTHGTSGLLFLRSYPEKVKKRWGLERTPMEWFSTATTPDSLSPHDLNKVVYIASEFLKKTTDSVIMIEGIEYLITQNDFLSVLKIIHTLRDLVVVHSSHLIISVNQDALDRREMTLLEKEAKRFYER